MSQNRFIAINIWCLSVQQICMACLPCKPCSTWAPGPHPSGIIFRFFLRWQMSDFWRVDRLIFVQSQLALTDPSSTLCVLASRSFLMISLWVLSCLCLMSAVSIRGTHENYSYVVVLNLSGLVSNHLDLFWKMFYCPSKPSKCGIMFFVCSITKLLCTNSANLKLTEYQYISLLTEVLTKHID